MSNENRDELGRYASGESSVKAGSILRFGRAIEPGDENVRFKLVKERGDKITVRAIIGGRLAPAEQYNKWELRAKGRPVTDAMLAAKLAKAKGK